MEQFFTTGLKLNKNTLVRPSELQETIKCVAVLLPKAVSANANLSIQQYALISRLLHYA